MRRVVLSLLAIFLLTGTAATPKVAVPMVKAHAVRQMLVNGDFSQVDDATDSDPTGWWTCEGLAVAGTRFEHSTEPWRVTCPGHLRIESALGVKANVQQCFGPVMHGRVTYEFDVKVTNQKAYQQQFEVRRGWGGELVHIRWRGADWQGIATQLYITTRAGVKGYGVTLPPLPFGAWVHYRIVLTCLSEGLWHVIVEQDGVELYRSGGDKPHVYAAYGGVPSQVGGCFLGDESQNGPSDGQGVMHYRMASVWREELE